MKNNPHTNDIILKTTTTMVVFVIFAFAIFLFLKGHQSPGGGFIGGLVAAGGLVLLYMTYGFSAMQRIIRLDFKKLTAFGLLIAVLTGAGSFLFGEPFLSHTYGYLYIPVFGKVEWATALLFDLGVFLTVIGMTMTIMLGIAADRTYEKRG